MKIILRVLFPTVLCGLLPSYIFSQILLSGIITDAETGSPLPGASLFVPELKVATVSDNSGNYRISGLHKGNLLLQFSHLGYETYFANVLLNDTMQLLNVVLRPSQMELKEVKIIGTQASSPKETPFTVNSISAKEIRENGSLSISDAVAKLPGVSQLTTGAGISKPVIRGLYGNRVQVNVMGLRFDNQQWQDEHGLGLSNIGIDQIEIIKGPATLMYGSDAMGGVLNVVEEKPAQAGTLLQDVNFKMLSNTLGTAADYGIRKTTEHRWWRLRAGTESNGDYSSSGNTRVLNSRFENYNVKASTGFNRKNWVNVNNAFVSFSRFGFVFDSLERKTPDNRISRTFDGPHHTVFFSVLSSENTIYKDKTKIKLNGGFISNLRQEQEGGNRISLNMLLNTASLICQASKPIGGNGEWTNGTSLLAQTNTNYGSRTIVPDAFTFEGAVFSHYKHRFEKMIVESGLRYDRRQIQTFETQTINGPGSEIKTFHKGFNALNGSFGFAYNPFENLNIKGNSSSGYRSGNLAELSSNGLHEGTARWETGNPDLKVEQNICSELGFTYELEEQIEFSATGFYNRFFNYIYLAPTGLEYFGFNIYRFRQTNATLAGNELSLDVHPVFAKWLDVKTDYTYLDARKSDGTFLPFIPANKLNGEIKLKFNDAAKVLWTFERDNADRKIKNSFFKLSCNYVFAQNRPSEFETSTPKYLLFNAGIGGSFQLKKQLVNFNIVCTNLTDVKYVDHLSRFKYYGIYNIGRNVSLTLNLPF